MDECGEWADGCGTMIGKNQQLVTDEPVVFEKQLVELQDCKKITYRFRGIYKIYSLS